MKQGRWLIAAIALVVSACATGRGPEHFYFGAYSEGERLFNKGQYEEAITQYQSYIDENPEGNLAVIAKFYLGKSQAALGRYDLARASFEEVIRKNPDLVWADFAKTQLEEISRIKS